LSFLETWYRNHTIGQSHNYRYGNGALKISVIEVTSTSNSTVPPPVGPTILSSAGPTLLQSADPTLFSAARLTLSPSAVPGIPIRRVPTISPTARPLAFQSARPLLSSSTALTNRPNRGEFRARQTRQLPRAVDLKGRLLSCQSY